MRNDCVAKSFNWTNTCFAQNTILFSWFSFVVIIRDVLLNWVWLFNKMFTKMCKKKSRESWHEVNCTVLSASANVGSFVNPEQAERLTFLPDLMASSCRHQILIIGWHIKRHCTIGLIPPTLISIERSFFSLKLTWSWFNFS